MLWGWVLLSVLLSRAVIWGAARCTHRGEVYDVHDQAHRYALRAVLRVSNTNARPPFAPTCHVSPPVGLAAQCKGLALTHSAQRPAGAVPPPQRNATPLRRRQRAGSGWGA